MNVFSRASLTIFFVLATFLNSSTLYAAQSTLVPVNINAADAETISKNLTGIGINKARLIINYRETMGRFKSVEELTEVKGIGLKLIKVNRERILLE